MDIEKKLRTARKKVTPERLKLFSYMKKKHLFESKELVEKFPELGRASIFRTIKLFSEIWVVRKIYLWNNEEKYEVECCEKHHHEHMKCNDCGEILSFDSHNICNKIFAEAEKHGFKIAEHSVNIIGTCGKCSA